MGEDVGPCVLAQHEEHQDVEQAQEVDVDRADTLVFVSSLKDGFGAEGHGMSSTHSSLCPIHPLLAAIPGFCYYLFFPPGPELPFGIVFRSMKKILSPEVFRCKSFCV